MSKTIVNSMTGEILDACRDKVTGALRCIDDLSQGQGNDMELARAALNAAKAAMFLFELTSILCPSTHQIACIAAGRGNPPIVTIAAGLPMVTKGSKAKRLRKILEAAKA